MKGYLGRQPALVYVYGPYAAKCKTLTCC